VQFKKYRGTTIYIKW